MTIKQDVAKCLDILRKDLPALNLCDDYVRGIQADPYMPDEADNEYKLLAQRSKTNACAFVVSTPAQAMHVDAFRRTGDSKRKADTRPITDEWDHWQRSRLDARQSAVYRAALTFGHSFTVTEKNAKGKVVTRGLSPLRTAAIYEDPANDEDALCVVSVKRWNATRTTSEGVTEDVFGSAIAWDSMNVYDVTFGSTGDGIKVTNPRRHGLKVNPVTRFTAQVDLDGRTMGVVEPMIDVQDRLNQTVFDLLVTQTYSSFQVRTVTGMAPPMKTRPVWEYPRGDGPLATGDFKDYGEIADYAAVIDPTTGKPVPDDIKISQKRLLMAAAPDAKFGSLEGTPLEGYIQSIEMTFRQLAALSQTPPHHLLGQIANLSAEAMTAAETALARKVSEFQASFGESWERVFRLAAGLSGGSEEDIDSYDGEVIWRDMENRSLAQAGDALSKLATDLHIPVRGLWARVPGVTGQEIDYWTELSEKDDSTAQLADAISRSGATSPRPSFRQDVTEDGNQPAQV